MEHGPGTTWAGFPSSQGFGVGGQSYSSFLSSTVLGSCTQPSSTLRISANGAVLLAVDPGSSEEPLLEDLGPTEHGQLLTSAVFNNRFQSGLLMS